MKKILAFITVFFVFLFIVPQANAQLTGDLCKQVSLKPIVNDNVTLPTITDDLNTNPTVYYDSISDNYYYNDGTQNKLIDLSKNITFGIDVNLTELGKRFSSQKVPTDLELQYEIGWVGVTHCAFGLPVSVNGSQMGSTGNYKADNFFHNLYLTLTQQWGIPPIAGDDTQGCKRNFLGHQNYAGIKFKYGNKEIQCPNLSFQQGQRTTNPCKLTFDKPNGYTNSDSISMTATPIDVNTDNRVCSLTITCTKNVTLADGSSRNCSSANGNGDGISQLNPTQCNTAVDPATITLGPLDTGKYTVEYDVFRHYLSTQTVGQPQWLYEKKAALCASTLTVVGLNETPVPVVTLAASNNLSVSLSQSQNVCEQIKDDPEHCPDCLSNCLKCLPNGIWTGLGCLKTDVSELVSRLFEIFSGMLGGFIFLCVLWNGLKVMVSRGSPDALKKAQEAITSCIIGLLVLMFSVLFLKAVGVDILRIPGWDKPKTQQFVPRPGH